MAGRLFEVAVLERPKTGKKEEDESGTKLTKLVFGPCTTVALDEQGAIINVIMANAEALGKVDRERMQVVVRPF